MRITVKACRFSAVGIELGQPAGLLSHNSVKYPPVVTVVKVRQLRLVSTYVVDKRYVDQITFNQSIYYQYIFVTRLDAHDLRFSIRHYDRAPYINTQRV